MLDWLKHSVKGYHFSGKRLGFRDNRLIEAGKTYEARIYGRKLIEKPALCRAGMHASKTPYEVMTCAPVIDVSYEYEYEKIYVSEVTVHGVNFFRNRRQDKFVGISRTHHKVVKLDQEDIKYLLDLFNASMSYDSYGDRRQKCIKTINEYIRNIFDASDS